MLSYSAGCPRVEASKTNNARQQVSRKICEGIDGRGSRGARAWALERHPLKKDLKGFARPQYACTPTTKYTVEEDDGDRLAPCNDNPFWPDQQGKNVTGTEVAEVWGRATAESPTLQLDGRKIEYCEEGPICMQMSLFPSPFICNYSAGWPHVDASKTNSAREQVSRKTCEGIHRRGSRGARARAVAESMGHPPKKDL